LDAFENQENSRMMGKEGYWLFERLFENVGMSKHKNIEEIPRNYQ